MSGEPVATRDPASAAALAALVAALRRDHGDAVDAVLVYGSCLRSGDVFDGLVDLYLVVRDYRSAYGRRWLAVANALLPPNVFYAQQRHAGRLLRSKVTVVSGGHFRRGCRRWFQSYLWGRFSQPVQLAFVRDDDARALVEGALRDAQRTLLARALPALPASGTLAALWAGALQLSYDTELRTERAGRAQQLVAAALPHYQQATRAALPALRHPLQLDRVHGAPGYRACVPPGARRRARCAWALRRLQGKTLSLARLLKALFTFRGGLDYLAWKLERHSGEPVEIPPRVRRHPLLFSWGFFWRLYRRGIFR